MWMVVNPSGQDLIATRSCEIDVFEEAFGNTLEDFAVEYGPYEAQSLYLSVLDESDTAVGFCRMIAPGPSGLKTLNDIAHDPWNTDGQRALKAVGCDLASTWDMATLGVRKDRRGDALQVSLALYHGIVNLSSINDFDSVVAILDSHIWRLLTSVSFHFQAIPTTFAAPYLGSASSAPVYGRPAAIKARQRKENPDAYRLMTLGIGIDGISLPPDRDYLIQA